MIRRITRRLEPLLRLSLVLMSVTGVVLGAAVGALLLVDRVNPPLRPVDPGIAAIDSTKGRTRLLILHVDSWRDQAARDSALFPTVARLRRAGASGTLLGVYEGFTIPAVRAAFTGHAETQLVNVVRNFRFRALPIESFFRDVHGLGRQTLVVAREPFTQFGPVFTERFPPPDGRDMYATDHLRPAMALRAYREESFDVIVCHWESFDWVAHEEGITTARYRAAARQTDSIIAAFAAARAPTDYLLVYGDHGHTETGEHKTGYDIPSYWLLLGPDVKAGVALPSMPITVLRYVASYAQGIRLRSSPYDVATLRLAIPVPDADEPTGPTAQGINPTPSRRPTEYLLALAVLIVAVVVATWCWWLLPAPALGSTAMLSGVVLLSGGLLTGLALPPLGEPLRVDGLPAVVFTYATGVLAKMLLLRDGGRVKWPAALAATLVLALVEFRVIADPRWLAVLAVIGIVLLAAAQRAGDRPHHRLVLLALLQLALYFTLRLPLYLYAWIDLFLLVAATLSPRANTARRGVLRDVLLVGGAWALSCGALAGNLEWGFLYTIFPAHRIELEVQWFLPIILAKIPLLLVLSLVAAGRIPDRALGQVVMTMTALRFAAVWVARLAGAPTAEVWPLAEQGAYLSTFVIAVVFWGGAFRFKAPFSGAR